jgi:hypothetical protein
MDMTIDINTLKGIVCEAISTHIDEISCADCFERLDRFAEMTLSGQDTTREMPLIHEHLERCRDCNEEFGALLKAIRSLEP